MNEEVRRIAAEQAGVVSRAQVVSVGLTDRWLQAQLAGGRWQRVHHGVYATFTGPLDWDARCWAALLHAGCGAALAGRTALSRWGLRSGDEHDQDVEVAVEHSRRVRGADGIRLMRVRRLDRLVHPARQPPVLRVEAAVLLTAARAASPDGAIGVIADACQQRRTTPTRLSEAVHALPRNLRFRAVIADVLDDVATGAYSYLEVHFLRDVERPHRLPTAKRQRAVRRGRQPWFRDVEYVGFGLVAELDGRLGHEAFLDRGLDMDRDNTTSLATTVTVRVGYRQTISSACLTAGIIADLLRQRGWSGQASQCGRECPLG